MNSVTKIHFCLLFSYMVWNFLLSKAMNGKKLSVIFTVYN